MSGIAYQDYAGVVLGGATLLLAGLMPQFKDFLIPHEAFSQRAQLLVTAYRSQRQRAAAIGVLEAVDDPGLGNAASGPLADAIRVESICLRSEMLVHRMLYWERLSRGLIVIAMVVSVVVAVLGLTFPAQYIWWAVAGVIVFLSVIAMNLGLYGLCSRIERLEGDERDGR